ncbi:MAG: PHP domain-containing protein, partial [Calditrichaeota bacterium]|nr:PHP domain-containing protein [Calditrichota bacterium]
MRSPVPLMVRSEFSFLNGASRLEELVKVAAQLGYDTLALTDVDHLCGVPEFLGLCKRHGVRPILGLELTLNTGRVIALAKSRKGFASLCRLVTESHLENERRQPMLQEDRLLDDADDLILIAGGNDAPFASWVYQQRIDRAEARLRGMQNRLGADFFVRIERTLQPMQQEFNARLTSLCSDLRIPVVACNSVHYARPNQYRIFDLLSCIRNLIKLDDPHPERPINGFGYLQSPIAFTRLFADMPQALEMTHSIADRCENYSLNDELYRPRFGSISEDASIRELYKLTEAGARRKYGSINDELDKRIKYELSVITD